MKAVCFDQVQKVDVRDLPDPCVEDSRDAIVRVHTAGLCGSDLHPFFGREQGIDRGTVLGHEFVGEVIAVGDAVSSVSIGQRVCAPFTTNCGDCFYCRTGLTSRCTHGQLFGWREQGQGLHGGQATMVRVPLADATLMTVPEGTSDETALLLGDNLSTGYFAAEMVGIDTGWCLRRGRLRHRWLAGDPVGLAVRCQATDRRRSHAIAARDRSGAWVPTLAQVRSKRSNWCDNEPTGAAPTE